MIFVGANGCSDSAPRIKKPENSAPMLDPSMRVGSGDADGPGTVRRREVRPPGHRP
jgi:hypothetical protein